MSEIQIVKHLEGRELELVVGAAVEVVRAKEQVAQLTIVQETAQRHLNALLELVTGETSGGLNLDIGTGQITRKDAGE